MNLLGKKLANLINVKTIVTFVIMAVFTVLALRGTVDTGVVMTIVTTVIAFYFGTQKEKKDAEDSNPTV